MHILKKKTLFQVAVPPTNQYLNTSVHAAAAYSHLTGVTIPTQLYTETRQQTAMSGQNIDPKFLTSRINIPPQNIDNQGRVDPPPPYSQLN